MNNQLSQKTMSISLLLIAGIIGVILAFLGGMNLLLYWAFGLAFGITLQHFGICFVSSAGDLFAMQSTTLFRAILIGILVASMGIAPLKYLSFGEMDFLSVSAISLPLILGAFIFGLGMMLSGACASGMLVRLAEGFTIHIFTIIGIFAGFMFASTHFNMLWTPLIAKGIVVFLPDTFGWSLGIVIHLAIILVIYGISLKTEKGQSSTQSSKYLLGGIFLGIFSILHYIALKSGWSVTGAFFWFEDTGLSLPPNIRNLGIIFGALISALFVSNFKLIKIRSKNK